MRRKNLRWQEWSSATLLMIGATLISLNSPISKWAFPFLCLGRAWLTYLMYKRKYWPLFYSDIFFVIIYLIGIYRWFFT